MLFNLAAAMSLFVVVVAATGWVASCFTGVGVVWRGLGHHDVKLFLVAGGAFVGFDSGDAFGPTSSEFLFFMEPPVSRREIMAYWGFMTPPWVQSLGFLHVHRDGGPKFLALIPCWFLILLSIPLPVLWVRDFRRRRALVSCCTSCGYDLRGSPAEGDCPECGAKRPVGLAVGEKTVRE
ncbi:MAG: hypothetical protein NTW19_09645 [Planctomycetota bacterium]|nr:hypothetical protein [Planctomycetota bacterium]